MVQSSTTVHLDCKTLPYTHLKEKAINNHVTNVLRYTWKHIVLPNMSRGKEQQTGPSFADFCEQVSLHGWNFFVYSKFKPLHVAFWAVVIAASFISGIYVIANHVREFTLSTVSYNLESPTIPLDDVYFPSVVICNMNSLRRSFIHSLMTDPIIKQLITFRDLWTLIDEVYIDGGKDKFTAKEQLVINRIFESEVYDQLYLEFINATTFNPNSLRNYTNVKEVFYVHAMKELTPEERFSMTKKKAFINEIASQFRPQEVILSMKFNGYGINHDGGGFTTDISETCHWLTPFVLEPVNGYDLTKMKPFARNGLNNGLQLLLDAESYDYASSKSAGEGFALSILYQLDIPIMKHTGIVIEAGQASQIAVTPTLINTTSEVKRRFIPTDRQCYFEDEIELQHFPPKNSFRYEMSNCLFEATLQEIRRICKCVPNYFAKILPAMAICSGESKQCMNELRQLMGDNRTIIDKGVSKTCLANCVDQKYSAQVTQASYPNQQSFVQSQDFCIVLLKLVRSCRGDRVTSLNKRYPTLCKEIFNYAQNQPYDSIKCPYFDDLDEEQNFSYEFQALVSKYAKENIAKVSIFLRDPYVQRTIREEKITEITFVGTVGGLLGLFLGFSFISGVEVFYLTSLKVFSKCQSCNSNNTKINTFSTSTNLSDASTMKDISLMQSKRFMQRALNKY